MSTTDREAIDRQTEEFLAANDHSAPCSCGELRERLFEFLDHELADSDEARLRRHVATCPECTAAADAEEHIRTLLKRSCAEQAPQGLRARVVSQLTVLRTAGMEASVRRTTITAHGD